MNRENHPELSPQPHPPPTNYAGADDTGLASAPLHTAEFDFRPAYPQLVDAIIEQLRNTPKKKPPADLLTGLSGMGKSALLLWLETRIREDDELSAEWIPLATAELPLDIHSPGDFWRHCLHNLDRELAAIPSSGAWPGNEDTAALNTAQLLQRLQSGADKSGRRLLLLVDNLQILLARSQTSLDEFLRLIRNQPFCRMISTWTVPSADDELLREISEDRVRIHHLVGHGPTIPGPDGQTPESESVLAGHVARGLPAPTSPVLRLGGGNLKTSRLLTTRLRASNAIEAQSVLCRILDTLSAWYGKRLDDAADQDRVIIEFLARKSERVTLAQMNEATGVRSDVLEQRLEALCNCGWLTQTDSGESAVYDLREYLFVIWYLSRTRAHSSYPNRSLVKFLQIFFPQETLIRDARQFLLLPPSGRAQREAAVALLECVTAPDLKDALEHALVSSISNGPNSSILVAQLLGERCRNPRLQRLTEFLETRSSLGTLINERLEIPDVPAATFVDLLLGSPSLEQSGKRALSAQLENFSVQEWNNLYIQLSDEAARWRELLGHHASILYKAIGNGEMASLDDTRGAAAAAQHWQNPVIAAIAWDAWHRAGNKVENSLETIHQAYQTAIDFDPRLPLLWSIKADLLGVDPERIDEAESAYRKAIELHPSPVSEWSQLGHFLKALPGRKTDAGQAYLQAVELSPRNAEALNNQAWFLYQHTTRLDEAVTWAEKAVAIEPDNFCNLHTLATLETRTGHWDRAARALVELSQQAIPANFCPESPELLILFREVLASGKHAATLEILDADSTHPDWLPLRKALDAIEHNTAEEPMRESRLEHSMMQMMDVLTA